MSQNNPTITCPQGFGSHDKLPRPQGKGFAPDQAGCPRPAGETDDEDDESQTGTEDENNKDQQKKEKLSVYSQRLGKLLAELTPLTSAEKRKSIEEFFWLLEELKISLFAQELKTPFPISEKRLEEKRREIERMV